MDPHQKASNEDLMACPDVNCSVVMFIRSTECPSCGTPGDLLRNSLENRGIPGWAYRVQEDD